MWDLPGPDLEPGSPALAGRFPTTVSPGQSLDVLLIGLDGLDGGGHEKGSRTLSAIFI